MEMRETAFLYARYAPPLVMAAASAGEMAGRPKAGGRSRYETPRDGGQVELRSDDGGVTAVVGLNAEAAANCGAAPPPPPRLPKRNAIDGDRELEEEEMARAATARNEQAGETSRTDATNNMEAVII
jgi:hypothetical protein